MARKSTSVIEAEKEVAKFDKNYAGNVNIKERALKYCQELVEKTKINRVAKEQEWLDDLRLWSCVQGALNMYQGRSNLVIPELNKQVETTVGMFQQNLFPDDDYIGAIPTNAVDTEEVEQIKNAVFHELHVKNYLPAISEDFQRKKVLFGTAFYRVGFEKSLRKVFYKNDKNQTDMKSATAFEGVRVKSNDTFHTYIYPEDCGDIQNAEAVFEEYYLAKRVLELDKDYMNLSEVSDGPKDSQALLGWIDTTRLVIANLGSASSYRPQGVLIHEVFCDFDIVPGEFVPCTIVMGNMNTILKVKRNPFWHQLKPYIMGSYRKRPSEIAYAQSLPDRQRSLSYMITDLANQTMDSLNYSLNPIALIDPGLAGDVTSFKLQPGAKWWASPQGVQFAQFPDVSQSGFQGMQQVRSMIQQFADNAPQIAPQLSGKVRSATQANMVAQETSRDAIDMVRQDEFYVMNPLCYMTHMLLRQYQNEDYQIALQSPEDGKWIMKPVSPMSLQKDAQIFWKGSSVKQQTSLRSQQLMNLYNLAVNTAAIMPGEIDLPALFKRVVKESFGIKDLDIFPKDREKKTIDQEIENKALIEGEDVDTHYGDDDVVHMEQVEQALKDESLEDYARLAFIRHYEKHKVQKNAKEMLQQQQTQLAAAQFAQNQQGPAGQRPLGNPGQTQNPSEESEITQGVRQTPNNFAGPRF